jgi:hypothetical protein
VESNLDGKRVVMKEIGSDSERSVAIGTFCDKNNETGVRGKNSTTNGNGRNPGRRSTSIPFAKMQKWTTNRTG